MSLKYCVKVITVMEYNQIQERRRLAEEKRQEEIRELELKTKAAIVVQAWWRGYSVRKALKNKAKSKKAKRAKSVQKGINPLSIRAAVDSKGHRRAVTLLLFGSHRQKAGSEPLVLHIYCSTHQSSHSLPNYPYPEQTLDGLPI
uniref:Dynein regulatory complex protein 10 n=1 Tax=Oreochromis niloticus TaxID=8128 RepID=A0A669EFX0_ORENI